MSPTAPVDEYHRISLDLTARIRTWFEAMRADVATWEPSPCPPREPVVPSLIVAEVELRDSVPYADDVLPRKPWLR